MDQRQVRWDTHRLFTKGIGFLQGILGLTGIPNFDLSTEIDTPALNGDMAFTPVPFTISLQWKGSDHENQSPAFHFPAEVTNKFMILDALLYVNSYAAAELSGDNVELIANSTLCFEQDQSGYEGEAYSSMPRLDNSPIGSLAEIYIRSTNEFPLTYANSVVNCILTCVIVPKDWSI